MTKQSNNTILICQAVTTTENTKNRQGNIDVPDRAASHQLSYLIYCVSRLLLNICACVCMTVTLLPGPSPQGMPWMCAPSPNCFTASTLDVYWSKQPRVFRRLTSLLFSSCVFISPKQCQTSIVLVKSCLSAYLLKYSTTLLLSAVESFD